MYGRVREALATTTNPASVAQHPSCDAARLRGDGEDPPARRLHTTKNLRRRTQSMARVPGGNVCRCPRPRWEGA
jgi:hypothetical protein